MHKTNHCVKNPESTRHSKNNKTISITPLTSSPEQPNPNYML